MRTDLYEIDIEEALTRDDLVFIDIRAPEEFANESIPGAVNIPLFDDYQHQQLGLIYHSRGELEARRAGLTFASARLPAVVEEITRAAGSKTILLYCWRGGLRSSSLLSILELVKIPALRLKGGYRAYRRHLHRALQNYCLSSRLIVLHGLTGVGKTAIIRELIALGYAAINLEELACHRGSVFGSIGFKGKRSQKNFEGLLFEKLTRFAASPYLIVEGEGRRIGNLHLPRFLAEAMKSGIQLLITASLPVRVQRILQEYLPSEPSAGQLEQLESAVTSLQGRLGKVKTGELIEILSGNDYRLFVEKLCTDYYDQLYHDARPENRLFSAEIEASSISMAVRQIAAFLEDHFYEQLSIKESVFK